MRKIKRPKLNEYILATNFSDKDLKDPYHISTVTDIWESSEQGITCRVHGSNRWWKHFWRISKEEAIERLKNESQSHRCIIEKVRNGKLLIDIASERGWRQKLDALRSILRTLAPDKTIMPAYTFTDYYRCKDGIWYATQVNVLPTIPVLELYKIMQGGLGRNMTCIHL